MNKVVVALIVILVIGVLGAYAFSLTGVSFSNPFQKTQQVSVRLAWMHNPQFAGFYVAKEKGYYRTAGLDVELEEYEDGLNSIDELVTGNADFIVSTPVEILPAIQAGQEIKAVAVIYQTAPMAFASLKAANIKTPADFRGKTLAAKGDNNEGKTKYLALMNSYNLKSTDAKIIGTDYSMDEADDLTNKRADVVDLYRTDQPFAMKQKGLDINLLLPENFGVTGYGDTIATTNALIDANPTQVKKFIAATMKGWEYAMSNPEEALEITAKYSGPDYKDPARAQFILEQSIPLIRPTGNNVLGDMNYVIWNDTAKKMEAAKVLKPGLDVNTVYTTQFVK